MANEEISTPSCITYLAILLDGRALGHTRMRKHHSKSAQVNGAVCGAWGGHTCTHLSSCPTSDTAMLWDLDFSRSLHTCSKLFWCHAASTVEIRSRGYGPVNLDHPGGPGQPYERSVRVCFSVPGIPVKSWDMSLILGQNFVTVNVNLVHHQGKRLDPSRRVHPTRHTYVLSMHLGGMWQAPGSSILLRFK